MGPRQLLRDEIPVGRCEVRALYSWSGESPQDLGFVEGDIIEVLNNGDGDWWTGKLRRNKQVGSFPRNFAVYVDPKQETMSAALQASPQRKKAALGEQDAPQIDFSTISLSDLAISDPQNGEEPSLLVTSKDSELSRHQDRISADQLRDSQLGASTQSTRSTKSAQEILDDIGLELNQRFLDDINLDSHTDELFFAGKSQESDAPAPPPHRSLQSSTNSARSAFSSSEASLHSRGPSLVPGFKVTAKDQPKRTSSAQTGPPLDHGSYPELGQSTNIRDPNAKPPTGTVPIPSTAKTGPPILVKSSQTNRGHTKRLSSAEILSRGLLDPSSLGGDASSLNQHSPLLEQDIPFDPKAFGGDNFKRQSQQGIGAHIGSHFDTGYNSQGPPKEDSFDHSTTNHSVTSTGPKSKMADAQLLNKKSFRSIKTPSKAALGESEPVSSFIPPKSSKSNFFQRLLPKNSQNLRRHNSRVSVRSSKSAKSTKSTKSAKLAASLRTVKSIFSFHDHEDQPYDEVVSTPAPLIAPPPAKIAEAGQASQKAMNSAVLNSSVMKATAPTVTPSNQMVATLSSSPLASITGMKNDIGSSPRNTLGVSLGTSFGASLGQSLGNSLGNSLGSNPDSNALSGNWIDARRDLYRAQTLTQRDIAKRRQELELQGVNCDDLVSKLNEEPEAEEFHDYRLETFYAVDHAVLTMSTWPQLMTPAVFASSRIGRHFRDPVDRVRAVFLLCSTRLEHVVATPPLNNVMQSRRATSREFAATVNAMCSALDIQCEIVEGHVRTAQPGAEQISSTPHWWNAVKLNDEWRLIDAVAAISSSSNTLTLNSVNSTDQIAQLGMSTATNPGLGASTISGTASHDDDGDSSVNLFYFLTPPRQLLFSHVPQSPRQQFITPPLPTAAAALLPLAAPAAFAHGVQFPSFWLGSTRLTDLDVAELILKAPNANEELVAFSGGRFALSQALWSHGERLVRVKAFVPPGRRQSLLQIFAARGNALTFVSGNDVVPNYPSLELLWSVELRHMSGEAHNAAFDFVRRHAAPTMGPYDLYVAEPQCRALSGGDTYTFRITNTAPPIAKTPSSHVKQPQLAVQSPSGRLTRLVPRGTDVEDTFRTSVKTLEVGTWRGVARSDEQHGWVPFAEWFCS